MATRNTASKQSSAARVARTRAKLRAAGLRPIQSVPSWAQIELLTTVRRWRVGGRIGCTDDATMLAINRALAVFLGLA
jgi:mRNA-degrading endonuclease toxin of MazEF toxin-antitoxin module